MNYIQSADGTLALRLEAHEAKLLDGLLYSLPEHRFASGEELELISAIRNAAATLNHE